MTAKSCGGCTACCHTIPVPEISVRSWGGCPHELRPPAARVGCAIYADRPRSCAEWNCQWHAEAGWSDEYRPDRCGIVVDILPDTFGLRDNTTGKLIEKPAMQFWVERGHENDWQDPDSPARTLIMSVTAGGKMGVLWRTYDAKQGQNCMAFWRDEAGTIQRCDGGPPSRINTDRERFVRALELMGVRDAAR